MSAPKPLRVVQVGLGDWGRDWAWRVIPDITEVELVGYVDSDPDALDMLRSKVRVTANRCFEALDQAVATVDPEAVLITTTMPAHGPIASAALKAGLHVLVEKPFAESLARAKELVEIAAANGVVLMVSQNYRFFPAVREVVRLVGEAELGRLHEVSIDFRRYSALTPDVRKAHHSDGQPLLVDMSIHHFDLLRLILGREPRRIYCEVWNPEWSPFTGPSAAVASIVFDGVAVSYRGSWVSTGPITPWAGVWRMEFERGELVWSSRDDNGALNDKVAVRLRRGRPKTLSLPEMARVDRWGTLTEFAGAIRSNREPEASGRDNLGSLALMFAAVESATRHEPIEIAPVG